MPFTQMGTTTAIIFLVLFNIVPMASAQSTTPVPMFLDANITVTDNTFTGRQSVVVLTSPEDMYELALIQDGFGIDTQFQYCWAEVHDTTTADLITWREPCNPIRVDECTLVLTDDGDLRLYVASGSASTVAFLTDTAGDGVMDVVLTDQGDLTLVRADNSTVWQSSQHVERQQKCREPFNPPLLSGSHRTRLASWFGVVFSVALTNIMALSS
ncbi:unnamed protein product [Calypogeia fissa]